MKTKALALLNIFGMLLWPLESMSQVCGYASSDADLIKRANECNAKDTMTWDCSTNRCIKNTKSRSINNAHDKCAAIADDQERKKCFDDLVAGAAFNAGLDNTNYASQNKTALELMGWANLIWGSLMGGSSSTCTSMSIMKYTGLALTAGEIYNYFFLSEKLEKFQKIYASKTLSNNAYNAQKEAFDYLLKEQELIAKVSKQKKIIYTAGAAGYTAAAGMAIYEIAMSKIDPSKAVCGTTSDGAAMSCAQVMGKTPTDPAGDNLDFTADSKPVKDQLLNNVPNSKEQFKNAALDAGKNAIDPFKASDIARDEITRQNNDDAQDDHNQSPKNKADRGRYDYESSLHQVKILENQAAGTTDPVAKKSMALKLIKEWTKIRDEANARGESDNAENASQAIKKWTKYLNSVSFDETKKINRDLIAKIAAAKNDTDAFVIFDEHQSFMRGENHSFKLSDYRHLKKLLPENHVGLKSSLITLMQFQVNSEAYADSKIGGLAKGMAIGTLKQTALRFALCAVAPKAAEQVSSWLQTPYAVAIMGTASAGMNFKLASTAYDQEQSAKHNAKLIQDLITNFELNQAAYCPQGRDDENVPECYCYTETGEKSNHTNSETCKKLWAKDEIDFMSKIKKEVAMDDKGCVLANGQIDEECRCRNLIDKNSGDNACMKTQHAVKQQVNINGQNMGAINGLLKGVESIAQGARGSANLDTQALSNQAISQSKKNLAAAEKVQGILKDQGIPPLQLGNKNAETQLAKRTLGKSSGRILSLSSQDKKAASINAQSLPEPAKEALENAMKKSGIDYSKSHIVAKNAPKQADYSYLFGTANNTSAKGNHVQNFEEKNYNFNENDIHNDGGATLFEILSHRFSTSGMKRLFGE